LCTDLAEALEQLPLSEDVKKAILEHEGPAGEVLAIVQALEDGNWQFLMEKNVDGKQLNTAYMEAIAWAKESLELLNG
jgi:EAL and modified HD-GYP domain-containing signal transduction protein